jgi:hypothetical protein
MRSAVPKSFVARAARPWRRYSAAFPAFHRADPHNRECAKSAGRREEAPKVSPQMNTDRHRCETLPVTCASRPYSMRPESPGYIVFECFANSYAAGTGGTPVSRWGLLLVLSVFICVHLWRTLSSRLSWQSSRLRAFAVFRTAIFQERRRGRCALAYFDRSTDRTSRRTVTMGRMPMPPRGVPRPWAGRPCHGTSAMPMPLGKRDGHLIM